jgi:hypothetical protein
MHTALDRTHEIEGRRPLVREEEQGRQAYLTKLSSWNRK